MLKVGHYKVLELSPALDESCSPWPASVTRVPNVSREAITKLGRRLVFSKVRHKYPPSMPKPRQLSVPKNETKTTVAA